MDKKTMGVVAACMLLLFLWGPLVNKIWPPIKVVEPAGTTAPTNGSPSSAITSMAAAPPSTNEVARGALTSATPAPTTEELSHLENELFKLTFSSRGGGIKLIELKNYPRNVTRKARGDSALAMLNENARLPVLAIATDGNHYSWQATTDGGLRATAQWANGVVATKDFTLASNYLVTARVQLTNPSDRPVVLPELEWSLGASTPLGTSVDDQFTGLDWFNGESMQSITETWFQNLYLGCFPGTPKTEYSDGATNVVWAGVKNQFFSLVTQPDQPAVRVVARSFELPAPSAADLEVNPKQTLKPMGHQAALVYGPATIPAGGSVERNFTIYAGPKEYNTLSKIAFDRKNQLDLVMNFGFFGFFAKALLLAMNSLSGSTGMAYGLTIVVITIIIKLIFWPLTNASTKSMKRMAKLQPQIKELQEKYKDDPQKMQRKMMEFWKENKVNPMGSCLPLLLQMPIFIGFYTMLQSAIELRGANFLWIADLSRPDTLFFIPGLGIPFNLMPLLMGATMLYQARLTPPSPGMDPTQQAMMRYMPLIFILMLYGMSSGLTLYWTVQNLLSILQTKLTKTDDAKPTAAGPVKPAQPANPGHAGKSKKKN